MNRGLESLHGASKVRLIIPDVIDPKTHYLAYLAEVQAVLILSGYENGNQVHRRASRKRI